MRLFPKSASAKKLTDEERYSCSATLPRWSFSVIIVFDLLIFEGWKLGSFDTHYMQGSGIFSRFSYYSFLLWRKHFLKSECDIEVFWCPDTSPTTWLEKPEERATKSVWDVLRYRRLKKQLLIFSETWSRSFCIVCNCFDDFRTNLPKCIGRIYREQNTKFPKRRWVRSKNVSLSAALLFSLVVNKKNCFEKFLRLHYLEHYVFFVQMQSHVTAALVFEGYVWYFRSLHLAFETSCDTENLKKQLLIFFRKRGLRRFVLCAFFLMIFAQTFRKLLGDFTESKTQNFQKDVAYLQKCLFERCSAFFFGCN